LKGKLKTAQVDYQPLPKMPGLQEDTVQVVYN